MKITIVFKEEPIVSTGNIKVELVYNVPMVTDYKKDGVTHVLMVSLDYYLTVTGIVLPNVILKLELLIKPLMLETLKP